MMKRFVAPYKRYLVGAVVLNMLSAIFNIFSFTLIIPILQILFKINDKVYEFIPWDTDMDIKEKLTNNLYFYVTGLIEQYGGSVTLLVLGLFLGLMTALKTSCYFGSSAVMVPLRTGVVRDIRVTVYNKMMRLPLGFFSQERKGDIIARMSGDVGEIEYAYQEPDTDTVLFHDTRGHELAADPICAARRAGNGMGHECNRQEAQEAVA